MLKISNFKSILKWTVSMFLLFGGIGMAFIAKPNIDNLSIPNYNNSNFILKDCGDGNFIPYVRNNDNKLIKGYESSFIIEKNSSIISGDQGEVIEGDSSDTLWTLCIPKKDVIVILSEDNFQFLQESKDTSSFDNSFKFIRGSDNALWFKNMRVIVPIDNKIEQIVCKNNDTFYLKCVGESLSFQGSSLETIDLLKKYKILNERAYFYNIYSYITTHVNYIFDSFGFLNGSIMIILFMLLVVSPDFFIKARIAQMMKNKSIEINIAKQKHTGDELNSAIKDINDIYNEKCNNAFAYGLIFMIFETYMCFGVIGDYSGFRGNMVGVLDLGLPEVVSFSNLFGILSTNLLFNIGPISLGGAIIISNSVSMQMDNNMNNNSDLFKIIQMSLLIYVFRSRYVFFIIFYSLYSMIRKSCEYVVIYLKNKDDINIVQ